MVTLALLAFCDALRAFAIVSPSRRVVAFRTEFARDVGRQSISLRLPSSAVRHRNVPQEVTAFSALLTSKVRICSLFEIAVFWTCDSNFFVSCYKAVAVVGVDGVMNLTGTRLEFFECESVCHDPDMETELRLSTHSSCVLVPLLELHPRHKSWRFVWAFEPPRDRGNL